MLSFTDKIELFKNELLSENNNYADFMKQEIYNHFIENDNNLDFLKFLNSKEEIENKIEFLVSKMIMHEHQEGLNNIIENYI